MSKDSERRKIMKELSKDNLTEKGNLKTSTQKAIREQAIKSFTDTGYELMPNGKLSKIVATIGDNEIRVNVELSVGLNTTFAKSGIKSTTKASEEITIPNLFETKE